MATLDDVCSIAANLPGAVQFEEGFGFSILVRGKAKGFLWAWAERVVPKKPRVTNYGVIAVMVPDLLTKDELIASDPAIYFTEDHYNGFKAVLVRIDAISVEALRPLVIEAWKCKASPEVVKAWEER